MPKFITDDILNCVESVTVNTRISNNTYYHEHRSVRCERESFDRQLVVDRENLPEVLDRRCCVNGSGEDGDST